MTVIYFDGDLTGDDWVMRYRLPVFGNDIERRPVAKPPAKPGLYFVDFGTVRKMGPSHAAIWDGSRWLRTNKQPFKATVTHWSSETAGAPLIDMRQYANG